MAQRCRNLAQMVALLSGEKCVAVMQIGYWKTGGNKRHRMQVKSD
jgi:hypothetical protein